jgi:hypothetical protein
MTQEFFEISYIIHDYKFLFVLWSKFYYIFELAYSNKMRGFLCANSIQGYSALWTSHLGYILFLPFQIMFGCISLYCLHIYAYINTYIFIYIHIGVCVVYFILFTSSHSCWFYLFRSPPFTFMLYDDYHHFRAGSTNVWEHIFDSWAWIISLNMMIYCFIHFPTNWTTCQMIKSISSQLCRDISICANH